MFFIKKENPGPTLLGNLFKTDIHSHLVPGVDDGVKTLNESIHLIRKMTELGFKKLIITPHIHADFYPNSNEKLKSSFQILEQEIQKLKIPIGLNLAAEYFLDGWFDQNLDKEELLSFGNQWVLVETSLVSPLLDLSRILFKLRLKGYQPVLAHPERYRYVKDFQWLIKLKESGCLFQLNIMSLTGSYGKTAKERSWELLEKGMIDFIGSDIHREKTLETLFNFPQFKKLEKLLPKNPIKNDLL